MNVLFERFVISLFQRARESAPLVSVQPQKPHDLTLNGTIRIQPDVTLTGPNESIVVVDAKYKRTVESESAKHPDLYQLIAYGVVLGLIGQETAPAQGILVYPLSEQTQELGSMLRIITNKTRFSEMTIRVVGLNLDSNDPVGEAEETFVNVLKEISRSLAQRS